MPSKNQLLLQIYIPVFGYKKVCFKNKTSFDNQSLN